MTEQTRFEAALLLCDHAVAVQGKLYITGGGWTALLRPGQILMGLAIRIKAPWSAGNEPMRFVLRLVDQDGQPVLQSERPVEISGSLTFGRPAAIPVGSDLVAVTALNIGLILAPGSYRWEMDLAGNSIARESFRVLQPPRNAGVVSP